MKKVVSILVAVLIVVFAAVPAFATEVISPSGDLKYEVTVHPSEGGTGDWKFTTDIDKNGVQWVHIWAEPYPGYTFDHWDLVGDYEMGEYNYTDGVLNIAIKSDLDCYPYFKKTGTTEVATATASVDTGSTSPQTGYANTSVVYIAIILSLLIVAAGATTAIIVTKKR